MQTTAPSRECLSTVFAEKGGASINMIGLFFSLRHSFNVSSTRSARRETLHLTGLFSSGGGGGGGGYRGIGNHRRILAANILFSFVNSEKKDLVKKAFRHFTATDLTLWKRKLLKVKTYGEKKWEKENCSLATQALEKHELKLALLRLPASARARFSISLCYERAPALLRTCELTYFSSYFPFLCCRRVALLPIYPILLLSQLCVLTLSLSLSHSHARTHTHTFLFPQLGV